MKKKGAALIISLLLVAVVSSTAFGIGRLMNIESNTVLALERSTFAYYATESGIEDGLLRYKYNQDTEVSSVNSTVGGTGVWEQSYALSMVATSTFYGKAQVDSPTTFDGSFDALKSYTNHKQSPYFTARDESRKIRATFPAGSDTDLYIIPDETTAGGGDYFMRNSTCPLIEVKLTGKISVATNTSQEKKVMVKSGDVVKCDYEEILGSSAAESVIAAENIPSRTDFSVWKISNLRSKIWSASIGLEEAEISIKPIGAGVGVGLDSHNSATFYGPYSRITSTGKFQGTTRKMIADIDRQSGSLYDLFDYVLYARDGGMASDSSGGGGGSDGGTIDPAYNFTCDRATEGNQKYLSCGSDHHPTCTAVPGDDTSSVPFPMTCSGTSSSGGKIYPTCADDHRSVSCKPLAPRIQPVADYNFSSGSGEPSVAYASWNQLCQHPAGYIFAFPMSVGYKSSMELDELFRPSSSVCQIGDNTETPLCASDHSTAACAPTDSVPQSALEYCPSEYAPFCILSGGTYRSACLNPVIYKKYQVCNAVRKTRNDYHCDEPGVGTPICATEKPLYDKCVEEGLYETRPDGSPAPRDMYNIPTDTRCNCDSNGKFVCN